MHVLTNDKKTHKTCA